MFNSNWLKKNKKRKTDFSNQTVNWQLVRNRPPKHPSYVFIDIFSDLYALFYELIFMLVFLWFRLTFLYHILNLKLNRKLVRNRSLNLPIILRIDFYSLPACYVHSMNRYFCSSVFGSGNNISE